MAGEWYLQLADEEIIDDFDVAEYDASRDRKALADAVRKAATAIGDGKAHAGKAGLWRRGAKHDQVAFKLAFKGEDIAIDTPSGPREEIFFASSENAQKALKALADEIDGGGYDDDLRDIHVENAPAPKARKKASTGKRPTASGSQRKSNLPARKDGLAHRVSTDEAQPHPSYVKNRAGTYWRSPEQVAADEDRSKRRQAAIAAK